MRTTRPATIIGAVVALTLTGCLRTIPQGYDGSPADGPSSPTGVNDEGTLISYTSLATNLVPGDTNGARDVFVTHGVTGRTERVSVSSIGEQANAASTTYQQLGGDGGHVVFVSMASNLAPDDTNRGPDVFVRDLRRDTTTLVSRDPAGRQLPWIVDRGPSISDDGGLVVFTGMAPSGSYVTYLYDARTGETREVPGEPLPADAVVGELSGDGNVLGWYRYDPGFAAPIAPVLRDLRTGEDDEILIGHARQLRYTLRLDAAGRFVVWSGQSYDGTTEQVVADRTARTVTRLDAGDGAIASPNISSTGRYVTVFRQPSTAAGATLYVYDQVRDRHRLVGTGYWTTLSRWGISGTVTPLDEQGPFLWLADRPWSPGLP